MPLLSANGTLRTVLVLLILWQLLRLASRLMAPQRPGTHQGPGRSRPKGDVRIERPGSEPHSMEPLDVEDADFEEIK